MTLIVVEISASWTIFQWDVFTVFCLYLRENNVVKLPKLTQTLVFLGDVTAASYAVQVISYMYITVFWLGICGYGEIQVLLDVLKCNKKNKNKQENKENLPMHKNCIIINCIIINLFIPKLVVNIFYNVCWSYLRYKFSS